MPEQQGGTEIVPQFLNFVPDSHVRIRPGSPAPISIAVAHLLLRASGSDVMTLRPEPPLVKIAMLRPNKNLLRQIEA
jgi:hypothetical protein